MHRILIVIEFQNFIWGAAEGLAYISNHLSGHIFVPCQLEHLITIQTGKFLQILLLHFLVNENLPKFVVPYSQFLVSFGVCVTTAELN